jgi:hypothetical protein
MLWGEVVCLDPLAWLRAGLVTKPGMFVLGQPGTGKSTLVKRLITGAAATGAIALILGDTKPDYAALTGHLGGQVIRIGRGLDRINPLDAGPLGETLPQLAGTEAVSLRREPLAPAGQCSVAAGGAAPGGHALNTAPGSSTPSDLTLRATREPSPAGQVPPRDRPPPGRSHPPART